LAPADFALLQLAGEIQPWEGLEIDNGVKWWTTHWNADGHFICQCGAEGDIQL